MSKRPRQPSKEPAKPAPKQTTAPKAAAPGKASAAKNTKPAAKTATPAAKPAAKTATPAPAKSTPAAKPTATNTKATAAKPTATTKPTAATAKTPSTTKPTAATAKTPSTTKPTAATAKTTSAAKPTAKPAGKTSAAKPSGVSARAVQQAARAAEAAARPAKPSKPVGRVRKAVESVIAYAGKLGEEVLERVTGGAEPVPLTAYLADPAPEDSSRPPAPGADESADAPVVIAYLSDAAEASDSLDLRAYVSDEAAPKASPDPEAYLDEPSAGESHSDPVDPAAYLDESRADEASHSSDPAAYLDDSGTDAPSVLEDSYPAALDPNPELLAYLADAPAEATPGPAAYLHDAPAEATPDPAAYLGETPAEPPSDPSAYLGAPPVPEARPDATTYLRDEPVPEARSAYHDEPDATDSRDPAFTDAAPFTTTEVVASAPADAIDVDAEESDEPAGPDAYLDPDALAERSAPIPAAYLARPPRTPAAVVYLADPIAPETTAETTIASAPGLGDLDFHLLAEGTHLRLYERLGAQVQPDGGTHFAVWAPNARQVSVIGEWNRWRPDIDPLTRHPSGVWQGHVPAAAPGMLYKYRVVGLRGEQMDRADPVAFASEGPPQTASRIATLEYQWRDAAWLRERAERQGPRAPISVYEMHMGSWLRGPQGDWLGYREVAPKLIEHLQHLGFTHVEFMPLTEHPFYGSWGYQTSAYFAPSARYGGPQALMYLIDELHRAGIGVILDWVPGHFPADDHGLGRFDGTYLYEHRDPRRGHQPDWNTLIFNLGRHEVRAFMLSSAMMWIERYHVDAIRVDAVASMLYLDYSRKEGEWIPNEHGGRENLEAVAFLRALNQAIHAQFPGVVTIAEESTAWPLVTGPIDRGGLGFDFKWDMGWMHDSLRYLGRDPIVRQHHHNELTFRMWYAYNERYMLPLSHDEVVHGKGSLIRKMFGDARHKFASLRLLLAYMFTTPGKKLLFMGAEFAQIREWDHDRQLDWALRQLPMHAGLERWVARLAHLYRDDAALHELDHDPAGFEWLVVDDRMRSLAVYLRLPSRGPVLMIALNFTPVSWTDHRIGLPAEGTWTLLDRSDAERYTDEPDAAPAVLPAEFVAEPEPAHDRPFSISVTLPPSTALVLVGPEATALRASAERHRTERLAREAAAALATEAAEAAAAAAAAEALAAVEALAAAEAAKDVVAATEPPGERAAGPGDHAATEQSSDRAGSEQSRDHAATRRGGGVGER